jgi:hypothetical protein
VGRGGGEGRVILVWVCVGRHRGSGVMCIQIQWGHLSNTRPGKFFLHVECPWPPPPHGAAAVLVLVLDRKHGNGHGNVARKLVAVLNSSEQVPTRSCERASIWTF